MGMILRTGRSSMSCLGFCRMSNPRSRSQPAPSMYSPSAKQPATGVDINFYTTIGELSSKFDECRAVRSQFDSDHRRFLCAYMFQSATFVRPLFAFYCPLFFTKKIIMWHFATDAMFTLHDWWICVIDKLRCANDGAGSSHGRLIARPTGSLLVFPQVCRTGEWPWPTG